MKLLTRLLSIFLETNIFKLEQNQLIALDTKMHQ